MRHYEIVFLVHPDQSEQVPAMIDRYKEMVTSSEGNVHRVEDWGRRRLAYMVNDVHKAHYIMINIECDLNVLGEIEKNFKFNDSILRHLIIRRKVAITEESPMAIAKAREDSAEAEKAERQAAEAEKSAAESEKRAAESEAAADDGAQAESEEALIEGIENPLEEGVPIDDIADDEIADEEAAEEEEVL